MTKSELAKNLQKRFPDLKEKEIEAIISIILQEVTETLAKGGRVELRGFGAFSLRKREARTARNPRTGEQVKVGARNSIYYRAGKALREYLNA